MRITLFPLLLVCAAVGARADVNISWSPEPPAQAVGGNAFNIGAEATQSEGQDVTINIYKGGVLIASDWDWASVSLQTTSTASGSTLFMAEALYDVEHVEIYATTIGYSIPAAPMATPATGFVPGQFTATWEPVSGATKYCLDVSTSSTFSGYLSGFQNLDVGDVASKVVTGISPGGQYYYRVRANNIAGTSGSSNTISTLLPPLPAAPIALIPEVTTSRSFVARWHPADGATSYAIDVSTSSMFSSYVWSNTNVGHVSSAVVTGLTANTVYYYRVRGVNSSGASGNSNAVSIRAHDGTLVATATAFGGGTYTIPATATRALIKVWGAGGFSTSHTFGENGGYVDGGAGGFASAAYAVAASQMLSVNVGSGATTGTSIGGHASAVWRTGGFQLVAGGGGSAGASHEHESEIRDGGPGGAGGPEAQSGGGFGGGGATGSFAGTIGGTTGAVGAGPMNLSGGGYYAHNGGATGGGGGGAGYYGGGSGAAAGLTFGAGGGGGGSNHVDTGSLYLPGSAVSLAGTGRQTPATSDANYAGSGGMGGTAGSNGEAGRVVILTYVAPVPPYITIEPRPQTVVTGTTATFAVFAGGTPAPTYQWYKNTTAISGATTSTFNLTNVQSGDVAAYSVTVTNDSSTLTSVGAALTIDQPPSAPTGLNYAEKTATTVTLIWRAATDDRGVVGYSVYRGGTLVGTTADVTFIDTGLTANTAYTYTVKTIDTAGTLSAATSGFNVTTTQDFTADTDGDGIPNAAETVLGTATSTAATADTTNQTQLNFHRPLK